MSPKTRAWRVGTAGLRWMAVLLLAALPARVRATPCRDAELLEGYGFKAKGGGATDRVILVTEPTEAAVRSAFEEAHGGPAIVRFEVAEPIEIDTEINVRNSFLTIDG